MVKSLIVALIPLLFCAAAASQNFCDRCGKAVLSGAHYCVYCGRKLSGEVQAPAKELPVAKTVPETSAAPVAVPVKAEPKGADSAPPAAAVPPAVKMSEVKSDTVEKSSAVPLKEMTTEDLRQVITTALVEYRESVAEERKNESVAFLQEERIKRELQAIHERLDLMDQEKRPKSRLPLLVGCMAAGLFVLLMSAAFF